MTAPLPALLRAFQRVEFRRKLGLCEALFARTLAARGTTWVTTPGGHRWKLDLTIPSHRWVTYGLHDRGLVRYLRSRLSSTAVLVDSGANVGQMLVSLVESVAYGRYLAIEPEREAGDWLRECLDANPDLRIEVVACALGATPGRATLAKPPGGHGCQSFLSVIYRDQEVEVVRLADVLRERGIARVDFWKIDVEGFELQVLKGADPLLRDGAIRDLYVELWPATSAAVREYMGAFGYRCRQVDEWGRLVAYRDESRDALFTPE
jgi:FkbM family methyltransferase